MIRRASLPGQECVQSSAVSLSLPGQSLPPRCTGGLLHERVRITTLPLQVLPQADHAVHDDQPPSTGKASKNI